MSGHGREAVRQAGVSVDVSGFSIHPAQDGYTWLACVRCGPEDYGTALVCLDDAHPLPDLLAAMAAHVCEEER